MLSPPPASSNGNGDYFWARFADELGDLGADPPASGTPASATSPSVPATSAT